MFRPLSRRTTYAVSPRLAGHAMTRSRPSWPEGSARIGKMNRALAHISLRSWRSPRCSRVSARLAGGRSGIDERLIRCISLAGLCRGAPRSDRCYILRCGCVPNCGPGFWLRLQPRNPSASASTGLSFQSVTVSPWLPCRTIAAAEVEGRPDVDLLRPVRRRAG